MFLLRRCDDAAENSKTRQKASQYPYPVSSDGKNNNNGQTKSSTHGYGSTNRDPKNRNLCSRKKCAPLVTSGFLGNPNHRGTKSITSFSFSSKPLLKWKQKWLSKSTYLGRSPAGWDVSGGGGGGKYSLELLDKLMFLHSMLTKPPELAVLPAKLIHITTQQILKKRRPTSRSGREMQPFGSEDRPWPRPPTSLLNHLEVPPHAQ